VAASQWTVKESRLVNQSTPERAGQGWSNRLFYTIFGRWFLCRNPKWPKKERVIWRQFITDQTVFGNKIL